MRAKRLKYTLPDPRQDAGKRFVLFAMIFVLLFVVSANLSSFLRVYNMYNYDSYLNELYEIKKRDGVAGLKNINNDCFAYLECEDIDMHLPIVSTSSKDDENHYLDHDFRHMENELGTPYQKFGTSLNQTTNTVFVGHSAFTETIFNKNKKQSIFGKLNNYLVKKDMYNYTITIDTIDNHFTYKIISVIMFYSNSIGSTSELSIYDTVNLETEDKFDNFYRICKNRSVVGDLDSAVFGDKFLTLFTCSTSNLDYRVMVVAKLV